MELRVNSGHASAQQLKRASAGSAGDNTRLITCADEVLARCEVCQAFEQAPHAPVAGTSTAAMLNQKLQEDIPRTTFSYRFAQRIPKRRGMPFAALGVGFLVLRGASSCKKVGNGRVNCGQNCALNCGQLVRAEFWTLERCKC